MPLTPLNTSKHLQTPLNTSKQPIFPGPLPPTPRVPPLPPRSGEGRVRRRGCWQGNEQSDLSPAPAAVRDLQYYYWCYLEIYHTSGDTYKYQLGIELIAVYQWYQYVH